MDQDQTDPYGAVWYGFILLAIGFQNKTADNAEEITQAWPGKVQAHYITDDWDVKHRNKQKTIIRPIFTS